MIDFDFTEDCCGCRVCGDVCPTKCITFITNKYGWIVPQVDKSQCINCHICEKKCPHLSYVAPSDRNPKCFSAYSTNEAIREAGSSGSIFSLLANRIISEGGIVFGAAFDSELRLKHTGAQSTEELKPLMKSKYVQSDTSGIYVKVLAELKAGRKVMFVGTPCQTVALHNIVPSIFRDNLLLVDFICHGVPGQQLFDRCIAAYEHRNHTKVLYFNFRKKTPQSLHSYELVTIDPSNGAIRTEIGPSRKFPYYYGYLRYFTFRDTCYKCRYLGTQRVSDITLGDFWFLETLRPITDFNKGYSMITINSANGLQEWESLVSKKEVVVEEFPIETAIKLNFAYTKPTPKSIVHKLFKHAYSTKPFEFVEKHYFQARVPFFKKCIRYIIVKSGI